MFCGGSQEFYAGFLRGTGVVLRFFIKMFSKCNNFRIKHNKTLLVYGSMGHNISLRVKGMSLPPHRKESEWQM